MSTEITSPSTSYPQRIVLLFADCDEHDEVVLVPAADTFQWVFTGNPRIPASDPFPSEEGAWAWAWRTWRREIQIAENFPMGAR